VIRGRGKTESEYGTMEWSKGDLFTLPNCDTAIHFASEDTAIYWVTDEALVNYLGVRATKARFQPCLYSSDRLFSELKRIAQEPGASKRNRIGVILGNKSTQLTRSLTHTLWALMVYLPGRTEQKPHRHNSVALDFVIDAPESAYTLVGKSLDADGKIIDGERVYWKSGSVFVTPPGLWHSHHNDSDEDALILPIQDAAFHSYLRTLDQRWS
jgi:gentisate 1,2-dioxygenase